MDYVNKLLICLMGLPRSGKSSWARQQNCPIVCPDAIRLAIHGHDFIQDAEPFVWATARTMVRALFLAGNSTVIVDATNTTKQRRADWFDARWRTVWKPFDTHVVTCLQRAAADNRPDLVPVIEKMWAKFEPLDASCELYDNLFKVRND